MSEGQGSGERHASDGAQGAGDDVTAGAVKDERAIEAPPPAEEQMKAHHEHVIIERSAKSTSSSRPSQLPMAGGSGFDQSRESRGEGRGADTADDRDADTANEAPVALAPSDRAQRAPAGADQPADALVEGIARMSLSAVISGAVSAPLLSSPSGREQQSRSAPASPAKDLQQARGGASQRTLHKDLHPGNVAMSPGRSQVALLDLGLPERAPTVAMPSPPRPTASLLGRHAAHPLPPGSSAAMLQMPVTPRQAHPSLPQHTTDNASPANASRPLARGGPTRDALLAESQQPQQPQQLQSAVVPGVAPPLQGMPSSTSARLRPAAHRQVSTPSPVDHAPPPHLPANAHPSGVRSDPLLRNTSSNSGTVGLVAARQPEHAQSSFYYDHAGSSKAAELTRVEPRYLGEPDELPGTNGGPAVEPIPAGHQQVIQCPPAIVGRIIGKGGETIRLIQSKFAVHVDIRQQGLPAGEPRPITITGSADSVAAAAAEIEKLIDSAPFGGVGSVIPGATVHAKTIDCPRERIAQVIGRAGATIRRLEDASGARLQLDQHAQPGPTITISSQHEESVATAERMLQDLFMQSTGPLAHGSHHHPGALGAAAQAGHYGAVAGPGYGIGGGRSRSAGIAPSMSSPSFPSEYYPSHERDRGHVRRGATYHHPPVLPTMAFNPRRAQPVPQQHAGPRLPRSRSAHQYGGSSAGWYQWNEDNALGSPLAGTEDAEAFYPSGLPGMAGAGLDVSPTRGGYFAQPAAPLSQQQQRQGQQQHQERATAVLAQQHQLQQAGLWSDGQMSAPGMAGGTWGY